MPAVAAAPPEGLVYRPEILTTGEERALLDAIAGLTLEHVPTGHGGQVTRRAIASFGLDYAAGDRKEELRPGDIPAFLLPVRERAAALAGVEPDGLVEVLVAEYPPGAGVGWHQDRPMYGIVVGVSLLAPAEMQFRVTRDPRTTWRATLAPRSAYVLAGPARDAWQHRVPPVKELRYSLTFRTLKNPGRWRITRRG